mmetsp:Transcript_1351/g.1818  ORF Transcript_1351/g.1818 Transcript_1351/m.1818 type:complete len:535 (-) Transcript_1351:149-1753(-)|eukprot:CAMPEP_0117755298 /NCGR_PEP_ID=MMETSP0947-20121206/13367_1 /TAXON_ID=44440 /ORGANISM="Chattonella subsalsa, Strain CCMP2191" /LENGTH=534 /DNA_ID=CAMNT_0005574603 /DNA_START=51 /DNA_END=1655 /DNA_ORIENTATION=+
MHVQHCNLCNPFVLLSLAVFLLCATQLSNSFILHKINPLQCRHLEFNLRSRSPGSQILRASTLPKEPSIRSKSTQRNRQQIADEGRALLQEALGIIRETGLRSTTFRTIQASRAATQTSLEILQDLRKNPSIESLNYPKILRQLFERLGATYIKLGQFVASSPTLFPADYVREFQKCLDQTPSVPYAQIKRIITEELGNPDTLFASIDPTPIASASVAQVHGATLKTGEKVVLKVLKPGVAEILKADLGFIYVTSRLLELLAPELSRTSLADIVGDIRLSMLDELDFTKEAKNIQSFKDFLRNEGLEDIATAPRVYSEYSSKRVLTMERLNGVPLVDLDGIKKFTPNPERTLINALNTWSLSVLLCDCFHADVHAGNLLVLDDGRVGFIDFGIVGRIPPKTWNSITKLGEAFASSNYRGMAEAMVTMGATDTTVNIDQFAADLEKLVVRITKLDPDILVQGSSEGISAQVAFDENQITELVLQVVSVSENNGLKLPREFGLLLKQSLYFDRYQRILAPELDILRDERIQGIIDV